MDSTGERDGARCGELLSRVIVASAEPERVAALPMQLR
jgi:hypothetical protein